MDKGVSVRSKAKIVVELIEDRDKYKEARAAAEELKKKMGKVNLGGSGGNPYGSYSS